MPTLVPITRLDVLKLRMAAKSAGMPTGSEFNYFIELIEYSMQQGEYFTFITLDGDTFVSMIEAAYPGFMEVPKGQYMKHVADGIRENGKHDLFVDIFKYRVGFLKTRWVANLVFSWKGDDSPKEAIGQWSVGSAGAARKTDMWKQIVDAIKLKGCLPFDGAEQAALGTKRKNVNSNGMA